MRFNINDYGAIVGTATYTQSGNNTNIANGQHGVLLAPAYEIQVDGFIPQEYVGDPYPFTGLYFAGDMRKTPLDGSFTSGYAIFNKYLGYTARQKVMATVYAELDPSGSQEQEESNNNPTSIIHLTKEYNSSQFTTTPAGVSPSNGTAHILPGAVPINTETAIPQTATVTVTHPSSRVVQAEFTCAVSDPLVWGSTVAPLYYDITVKIDASNPAQPTYTLSGNHKLFPAYEIYINHQLVHDYSPISGIGYSPAELAYPDSTAPSLSDSSITSQCATMPGLTGNITNQP